MVSVASLEPSLTMKAGEHMLDFVPHTAQPQPAVPIDLRSALFASVEEVQTATLPKPQLTAVISSYEKTIGERMTSNRANSLVMLNIVLLTTAWYVAIKITFKGKGNIATTSNKNVFIIFSALITLRKIFEAHYNLCDLTKKQIVAARWTIASYFSKSDGNGTCSTLATPS